MTMMTTKIYAMHLMTLGEACPGGGYMIVK